MKNDGWVALLDREVRVKGMCVESWITQSNMLGQNIKIHETRSLLTHIMQRPACQVTVIALQGVESTLIQPMGTAVLTPVWLPCSFMCFCVCLTILSSPPGRNHVFTLECSRALRAQCIPDPAAAASGSGGETSQHCSWSWSHLELPSWFSAEGADCPSL